MQCWPGTLMVIYMIQHSMRSWAKRSLLNNDALFGCSFIDEIEHAVSVVQASRLELLPYISDHVDVITLQYMPNMYKTRACSAVSSTSEYEQVRIEYMFVKLIYPSDYNLCEDLSLSSLSASNEQQLHSLQVLSMTVDQLQSRMAGLTKCQQNIMVLS